MSAKHSPAPWRAMEGGTIWTDERERPDDVPSGVLVCYLPPLNHGFHEPNARLIAAAPELLEALRHACVALLDPPSTPSGRVEMVTRWHALIGRIEEGM